MIEVLTYFSYCPLCYTYGAIISHKSPLSGLGGKDHIICINCGAKWHIKGSKWAKLEKTSFNSKGKEFLRKKCKLEFWQKMAYDGRKGKTPIPIIKEVVRQVVKVRCPYCHNVYDETYDTCPYCGAHR